MNLWDILILSAIAAAAAAAFLAARRRKKSGRGCCGSCKGCSLFGATCPDGRNGSRCSCGHSEK